MMRLEYQILAAVGLDLLLGDPPWLPHPVRGIAWIALRLEKLTRRWIRWPTAAGLVTALAVDALAGLAVWGLIRLATRVHPAVADAAAIAAIYTTLAARDLADHSMAVLRPLAAGDLAEARRRLGRIVGRDTEPLDASGVVRATLESVGENTVDGVTAPLLFAVLAGPVGAMVYRAINTLDSLFGYRDEPYRQFGWASARIDDLANYLPARLTAPLVCLAAALVTRRGAGALRIVLRDGRKHASPNSGLAEAAMAGALGVQLGGLSYYGGQPCSRPAIGDPLVPPAVGQIRLANALMLTASALFLGVCLAARVGALELWGMWRAAG
jgi:adenosylcobinamide-phosphate synthase